MQKDGMTWVQMLLDGESDREYRAKNSFYYLNTEEIELLKDKCKALVTVRKRPSLVGELEEHFGSKIEGPYLSIRAYTPNGYDVEAVITNHGYVAIETCYDVGGRVNINYWLAETKEDFDDTLNYVIGTLTELEEFIKPIV